MTDYLKKFQLDGKKAVVCGGLGLLGKEISLALAQAGAEVLILDINKEAGEAFEKENKKNNLKIDFLLFDVTDLENYEKTITELDKKYGPLHIWVNTAYPRTKDWGNKINQVLLNSWQKNIDTQLNAVCWSTKLIAEIMKKNGIEGSIVNLGSIYGVVAPDFEIYPEGMTCPAAYTAIKGGIISFSRYCASYYGLAGIRVNTICPGGVGDNQPEVFVKNYEQKTPLKRMAQPEDVAAAVLFLASEASSYITGTTFLVDGGWSII